MNAEKNNFTYLFLMEIEINGVCIWCAYFKGMMPQKA